MKCHYCNGDSVDRILFWGGADHWCAVCGEWKKLCAEHRRATLNFDLRSPGYGGPYDLCPECHQWRIDASNQVIAVASSHVGGHTIVEELEVIETRHKHKDRDGALWEIRYNVALLGANGIVDLRYVGHKASDGNYIYKKWTASGKAVRIVPR